MNKFFALKPEKVKELLKAAKPAVAIALAISSLQKKISEKTKNPKNKKTALEEIKKLKIELKKKEKELQKMGKKEVIKGSKATKLLLYHNRHFVQYLAKGYSSRGKADPEELTSEGISSLPKAIEKFDINSESTLPTYSGFWVKQYMGTYLKKIHFINQSSETKEKKNVVYYDINYQSDDKESKSYSLLETLHDEEGAELVAEQICRRDAITQTNNLINELENREANLLIRLLFKVKPSNLLDIYHLANEEEKKELKKKMKLSDEFNPELLQKHPLEEKKVHNLSVVKKYLSLFTKSHNFSEASKILGKSENMARRLKQESFKKLQKLAKERNLHLLLE